MCGGNRNAARLAGFSIKKLTTSLFINSGALAGFSGAVLAARLHSGTPGSVLGTEFKSITAAILGGVAFTGGSGTMGGCFIGLIIINSFNNGLSGLSVSSFYQMLAQGALLIAALLLDYYRSRKRRKKGLASAFPQCFYQYGC